VVDLLVRNTVKAVVSSLKRSSSVPKKEITVDSDHKVQHDGRYWCENTEHNNAMYWHSVIFLTSGFGASQKT
jgi:hypothetical protein